MTKVLPLPGQISWEKLASRRWLLPGILLAGLLLRLYLLFASQQMLEADEALVGLQAYGIMRGERPLFYPGQSYLGSLEAYLMAAVFWLLGPSTLTLKLVPLAFSILFIYTTFLLARELYNPAVGLLSALFVALCPLLLTIVSLKAWGGYIETPVLGNIAFLLLAGTLYRTDGRQRLWPAMLGLGFISGLGLWIHPQYSYYFGSTIVLLLIKGRRVGLGGFFSFVPAFAVGVAPLLLGSLGLTTKTTSMEVFGDAVPATIFWPTLQGAIRYMVLDGWLTFAGLRSLRGDLYLNPFFLVVPVYLAAVASIFKQTGQSMVAGRDDPRYILVVFLLLSPLVFVAGALTQLNWTAIISGSGLLVRYLMPLYTAVPILLAAFLWRLAGRFYWLAVVLTLLVLVVNLGSHLTVDAVHTMRSVYENVPLPASNQELIDFLEAEGLRYIYTNHWIGYRLMFEMQERVSTFDYVDSLYGMDRLPQYSQAVEEAPVAPAYLLFNPRWDVLPPLEEAFQQLGIGYRKQELQDYLVYYSLSRRVHPSEVMDALGWPYY
ncbi:MAG: ArnT family glycosyltransferase [Anaerolineae bacterium]